MKAKLQPQVRAHSRHVDEPSVYLQQPVVECTSGSTWYLVEPTGSQFELLPPLTLMHLLRLLLLASNFVSI